MEPFYRKQNISRSDTSQLLLNPNNLSNGKVSDDNRRARQSIIMYLLKRHSLYRRCLFSMNKLYATKLLKIGQLLHTHKDLVSAIDAPLPYI